MKLERKIYKQLLSWKNENGKTALLIEGARRVGKSTVVEAFAKKEYKSYILIDFSIASDEIKSLFKKYASNLHFMKGSHLLYLMKYNCFLKQDNW